MRPSLGGGPDSRLDVSHTAARSGWKAFGAFTGGPGQNRPMLPALSDLLATARVVDLPLSVPFRGITSREALLVEGPEGWSEFSPFVEYDDVEASRWLAGCIDFGWSPVPTPLRSTVNVNATVPAVAASEVASV